MSDILLYGVSGPLSRQCQKAIQMCYAVVASKRFDPLLTGCSAKRIAISPVQTMQNQVAEALDHGDVVVLASGDPLFFGIGRMLIQRFGPDSLRVYPALSALQLACARFRVAWDDLAVLSLHGRSNQGLAGRILGHEKVMLFTDQHNSPDCIAKTLLQCLQDVGAERRIETIRVRVAEQLATDKEKLTSGRLDEIAGKRFSPLNMMLIEQDLKSFSSPAFGLTESEITHSRGLITKDEVRSVVLHCLRLPGKGVFWDVGGGSGSISLEAAGLQPLLDIFTIEKKAEGQANIRDNIARFNRYGIQLIAGEAPEILHGLPGPDRIFIGGSGGNLPEIISYCAKRLVTGGILVASAVLQTTAEQSPVLMREAGLLVNIRTVAVTRCDKQGEKRQQLNPITLITGKK